MWLTKTKLFNLTGLVRRPVSGAVPSMGAFPGVGVDVFNVQTDQNGNYTYKRLNSTPTVTDASGNFAFNNLPVQVQAKLVYPGDGSPPTEMVAHSSLPTIVFLVSDVISFLDERLVVDAAWLGLNPSRVQVALTGISSFTLDVPDLGALITIPAKQFHLLRVGRVTRDEIGSVSSTEPGYMNSAAGGSFFPGVKDAPFGGTLQIGGHFGLHPDIDPIQLALGEYLYYQVFFSDYSGDPNNPVDLATKTQVLDPLFNKKYILPTPGNLNGAWDTMNLGPFNATLGGSPVEVYKRPPTYDPLVEYYPFPDLMAIWNSHAATNDLIIISVEVYIKAAGPGLQLTPVTFTTSPNQYLPLMIDNRRPVPQFTSIEMGDAQFAPESVSGLASMGPCGEMPVTVGDVNGNECIKVTYSIEDEYGNPHLHVNGYNLWVGYSPKGSLSSTSVNLKPNFGTGFGMKGISGSYNPATGPIFSVSGYQSILVPATLDGWPPEPNGNPPAPCVQYGAGISFGCSVRTINGWGRLFSYPNVTRHIIIKKV